MATRVRLLLAAGWLLLAASLPAQEVLARIELTSGRCFVAEVVRIEPEAFVLRVDGRELEIASDDVASLAPLNGDDAAVDAADAAADPPWEAEASDSPAPAVETAAEAPVGEERSTPVPASSPVERGSPKVGPAAEPLGPDAHIVDLLERFLWVVPSSGGHLTSIGAGLLLLMSWLLMVSGRAVGLDRIGFPRCLALAGVMLAILAVEASLLPAQPLVVGLALLVDLGLFVLVTAMLLKARLGQAVFVVAAFVFFSILLVMLSELVGVLLSARDLMGDMPGDAAD